MIRDEIDNIFDNSLILVTNGAEETPLGKLINTERLADILLDDAIKNKFDEITYSVVVQLGGELPKWLFDQQVFYNANLKAIEDLFVMFAYDLESVELATNFREAVNLHFVAAYFGDKIVFRNKPQEILKDDAELLAHETIHGLQRLTFSDQDERERSISYLTAYVEESRRAIDAGSTNPYLDNKYEQEAYKIAADNESSYIDNANIEGWFELH